MSCFMNLSRPSLQHLVSLFKTKPVKCGKMFYLNSSSINGKCHRMTEFLDFISISMVMNLLMGDHRLVEVPVDIFCTCVI